MMGLSLGNTILYKRLARVMVLALLVAGILYSLVWYSAAFLMASRIAHVIERINEQNINFHASNISVDGYPVSLYSDLHEPQFINHNRSFSWRSDYLRLEPRTLDGNLLRISAAPKHRISLRSPWVLPPGIDMVFGAQKLHMDLRFDERGLQDVLLTLRKGHLIDELHAQEPILQIGKSELLLRDTVITMGENEVPAIFSEWQLRDILLPAAVVKDPNGRNIDLLFIKAVGRNIGRLDRGLRKIHPTNPVYIDVSRFVLKWQDIYLTGNGELTIDDDNIWNGLLQISVPNYAHILELLTRNGLISENTQRNLRISLGLFGITDSEVLQTQTVIKFHIRDNRLFWGSLQIGNLENWLPILKITKSPKN